MSIITALPPPNLWEQACQEVQEEREELQRREDQQKVPPRSSIEKNYDPSKHHPALCGRPFAQVLGDYSLKTELDQSVAHPACASYWFAEPEPVSEVQDRPESAPDRKTCSNREFLEHYVWPCLSPALENTLIEAKRQGCFGLKKVLFNCLDYLTEYLYNHNPLYGGSQDDELLRPQLPLLQIPFVQNWLLLHPRPPQPVSLTWSEDETATKIQAAWRGYLTRRDTEVQELRRWQEEWRFINREGQIAEEVSGFWDKLMPDYTSLSTSTGPTFSSTRIFGGAGNQSLKRRRSSQGAHGHKKSSSASVSGHIASGTSATRVKQK